MGDQIVKVKRNISITDTIKVICILLIIVGIGTFFFTLNNGSRERYETQTTVVKNIKDMGELNVKVMNSTCKLTDYEGNKSFSLFKLKVGIPGTWHRMTIVFDAKVKAAVDLSNLKRSDVKVEDSKGKDGVDVTVKLKKPYISSIEVKNPEVYEDHGILRFSKDYSKIVNVYQKKMEKIAKSSAMKADLLKKAEGGAQKAIKAIVKDFVKNVNDVKIKFYNKK